MVKSVNCEAYAFTINVDKSVGPRGTRRPRRSRALSRRRSRFRNPPAQPSRRRRATSVIDHNQTLAAVEQVKQAVEADKVKHKLALDAMAAEVDRDLSRFRFDNAAAYVHPGQQGERRAA